MSSAFYCVACMLFTAFSFIFGWGISIEDDPTKAAVLGGALTLCLVFVVVAIRTAYHDERVLLDLLDSEEHKEA